MALVDLMNQLDEEEENARKHARACSEVITILEHFSQKDQIRIPMDFMHYLEKHRDPEHFIQIHKGLPLNEQDISREAKALLALIHIHFFCKTDADRESDSVAAADNNSFFLRSFHIFVKLSS